MHARFPGDLHQASVVPIGLPVNVGEVRDEGLRVLLSGFESLGEDCEFGLVQRRYGAEQLALFRWATTPPWALCEILERRLEGFGDPEGTEIVVAPWGELMAHDLTFDLRMHSFVHHSGVDLAEFHAKHCRRMAFLKTKLLADLAAGEKIFVYQCGADMNDRLAGRLAEILDGFGPNRLLAVGLADAAHASGSVVSLGPGLWRGWIDRKGKTATPGGHCWNINYQAWINLCGAIS